MKCIIYGCEEKAQTPFPAHNMNHGVYWRDIKQAFTDCQQGNSWLTNPFTSDMSLDEANYYAKKLI